MEIAGYIASIFIGIALGLIGSGGSILSIPILLYLFGVDAILATAYSLFIVGITSLTGFISYLKKGAINIKAALIFGLPSIASVFFTRTYILPAIPLNIIKIGHFTLSKSIFLLLLFAFLMIFASYSMIKRGNTINTVTSKPKPLGYLFTFFIGAFVGVLTGLVGAGGGFLIIPALVVINKLPMKEAVGTSLIIIAAKSLIGFWGSNITAVNWIFLLEIIALALVGIFIGISISKKIKGEKLKPAFGWFVLIIGIYIIIKETILK